MEILCTHAKSVLATYGQKQSAKVVKDVSAELLRLRDSASTLNGDVRDSTSYTTFSELCTEMSKLSPHRNRCVLAAE
jgi:hypothetical protein